eukprot:jgi/Botrbrau1/23314/Bobra.0102s0051.2
MRLNGDKWCNGFEWFRKPFKCCSGFHGVFEDRISGIEWRGGRCLRRFSGWDRKEAKELLKDRIKDMEPKVDNMIDSLPTNRQDLARTIKKAVVTNGSGTELALWGWLQMQALDKVLDHTVGEDPAPSKDSPPKSLAPPTPKNP